MEQALLQAQKAEQIGEVPVGAIIVREDEIIAAASKVKLDTTFLLNGKEE